ncbi:MAG: T9SS type A sorting domain-containing protein [Bacteroidales bacterium]|nr:T9SS type A sorting domain-containing protein [Bacteroidales bacterium]
MKKTLIISIVLIFAFPVFSQISDKPLLGVYSSDSLNCWAVGREGKILHTEDGGFTWFDHSFETNQTLKSIYFSDSNNGFIVGDSGTVLRTADGGQNWSQIDFGVPIVLTDVDFADENNGWIHRGSDGLYKTTNGGDDWSLIEYNNLWYTSFIDSLNGWGAVYKSSTYSISMYRTYDGGPNWVEICDSLPSMMWEMKFADSLNGIITSSTPGGEGGFQKTFDGGFTWTPQDWSCWGKNICFPSLSNIWIGTSGGIIYSNDFLETIDFCDLGYNSYVNCISAYGPNNGWAVGGYNDPSVEEGYIWKLSGLNDWIEIISTGLNESFKSKSNIKCFPNPSQSKTTISFEFIETKNVSLSIINTHGQEIKHVSLGEKKTGNYELNCTDLSPGFYFVSLKTDSEILTEKLLIE